ADLTPPPEPEWFEPAWWRGRGAETGTAPGRGSTVFIDAPFGAAALRRYLRGGWAARLSRDRYLYLGLGRCRSFQEFDLLRRMREAGLKVPAPVAALCDRAGPLYRAALITLRVAPTRSLAERLDDPALDWGAVGAGLRGFHRAGVSHADLTARNILVHEEGGDVWLLDFDRCSFRPGRAVDGSAQLRRLRRSLDKLAPGGGEGLERRWADLLAAYGA
ncbi:MAG: 3-deoxy-D-manno-octulosonic acid kinase, partial [Gammaproteobacteria bacterium]